MRVIYSPQTQGSCNKCKNKLEHGGFLVMDDDNQVSQILCDTCKDIQDEIEIQKAKVTVRQVRGRWFWNKYYEVISSKNILFKSPVITYAELHRLVLCKDIDVDIKY